VPVDRSREARPVDYATRVKQRPVENFPVIGDNGAHIGQGGVDSRQERFFFAEIAQEELPDDDTVIAHSGYAHQEGHDTRAAGQAGRFDVDERCPGELPARLPVSGSRCAEEHPGGVANFCSGAQGDLAMAVSQGVRALAQERRSGHSGEGDQAECALGPVGERPAAGRRRDVRRRSVPPLTLALKLSEAFKLCPEVHRRSPPRLRRRWPAGDRSVCGRRA